MVAKHNSKNSFLKHKVHLKRKTIVVLVILDLSKHYMKTKNLMKIYAQEQIFHHVNYPNLMKLLNNSSNLTRL